MDDCKQCQALRKEAGDLAEMYGRKLLIRGWAGVMSPVERAYVRKHRSEAQQAQAKAAGERFKTYRRT